MPDERRLLRPASLHTVGGSDDAGFVYGLGLESQLTYGTSGRIGYLEYEVDDVGVIRRRLEFPVQTLNKAKS